MSSDLPKLTPEQIQEKLREFLRTGFAQQTADAEPAETGEPDDEIEEEPEDWFEFDFKPRDIKRHLDRFVIRQDEAKKALAIAVCDHYNHARYVQQLREEGGDVVEYAKQNVLLVGPSGQMTLLMSDADLKLDIGRELTRVVAPGKEEERNQ